MEHTRPSRRRLVGLTAALLFLQGCAHQSSHIAGTPANRGCQTPATHAQQASADAPATRIAKLEIPPRFETVEDVKAGLRSLESQFYWAGDRRAVFASAYVVTTDHIARELESGAFHDGEWVTRYLVDFGNKYRDALVNYEAGRRDKVPPVWLASFDYSTSAHRLVLDDLWLGITAHVNRDNAFSLVAAGLDRDLGAKLADHRTINRVLADSVTPIRRRVTQLYAPGWGQMNAMTMGLAHAVTVRTMVRRRERAWYFAIQMAHSPTAECRQRWARAVEEHAALRANDDLVLHGQFPRLYRWLTAAEQCGLW